MSDAVVGDAMRRPRATAREGALSQTTGERLTTHIVIEAVIRSHVSRECVDGIFLAEFLGGGGALARHAKVAAGLTQVPGCAVNRYCAGSLAAAALAAAVTGCAGAAVETVSAWQRCVLGAFRMQRYSLRSIDRPDATPRCDRGRDLLGTGWGVTAGHVAYLPQEGRWTWN
jgi:acetyl-CoA acetyltransferase